MGADLPGQFGNDGRALGGGSFIKRGVPWLRNTSLPGWLPFLS